MSSGTVQSSLQKLALISRCDIFPYAADLLVLIYCQDLKYRYYSVCKKLIRSRPWPGDESSRQALLSSLQFDLGELALTLVASLISLRARANAETLSRQS